MSLELYQVFADHRQSEEAYNTAQICANAANANHPQTLNELTGRMPSHGQGPRGSGQ